MKKIFHLILICLMLSGFFLVLPTSVRADTLEQLQNEQATLNQQIQANRAVISSKQGQANDIQGDINNLSDQINAMQQDINYSISKINLTEQEITVTQKNIDAQEQALEKQKQNLFATVRVFYENQPPSTLEVIVGSDSLSDIINKNQYLDSISSNLNDQIAIINKTMADLEAQKKDLQNQQSDLENQKSVLVAQQGGLSTQQQTKNDLLNNTKGAISDLQTQNQATQTRLDQIAAQMQVLTGTSNWGNQIVSQDDASWYYQQTGNYTYLGRSRYTVSGYGCLITSIAMVDTYYGHQITPTDIAQMWWLFSSGGDLVSYAIPGISVGQSQPVNWNVVNSELAANHPVIVSIYLPSVGAINSDGSSHFIVIKGLSGSKYLMQDPIGPNRSYNLNQVRSMKILRPS